MTLLRMLSFAGASQDTQAVRPVAAARTESAASTARSSAASTAGTAATFDGDWPGLVERLGLTGLAGMVARHGELASYANGAFELVVPESHRMYGEKNYQDKLRAELQKHFGAATRLTVRVGEVAGTSLAAKRLREMDKRQASATVAIEDDPFVRDLVRDLGAEVVSSSIRPADEAPGGQTSDKR
jgi:DNA polymerase-3 subunit gamma/tau